MVPINKVRSATINGPLLLINYQFMYVIRRMGQYQKAEEIRIVWIEKEEDQLKPQRKVVVLKSPIAKRYKYNLMELNFELP